MAKIFIAMGLLVALIGMYIALSYWNRKTPIPEGCEDLVAECATCPIHSCLSNTAQSEEKKHGV